MAGGKLTPRQKMINMMYLVLTALLALNISKEIINAFVTVNSSLEASNKNTDIKNNMSMLAFQKSMQNDPVKTKPHMDRANNAVKLSDEFNKYIDGLKDKLIRTTEGLAKPEKAAIKTPSMEDIGRKDDYDGPTNLMCGDDDAKGQKGEAIILKQAIAKYKQDMIKNLDAKDQAQFSKRFDEMFNLSDPDPKSKLATEEKKRTWEMANFYHSPVVASVALLTKLQSDVKNAESEVITQLLTNINASDLKFTDVVAKVVAPTSYVLTGQQYKADIFLAAYNSTSDPEVYIGGGKLPTEGGMGKYTVTASGEGLKKYAGVIKVKQPDNTYKDYPFEQEYITAKPAAVISPTKMNVIYIGIDNPVSISVPGVPNDKVSVNATGGGLSLKKVGGEQWIARATTQAQDASITCLGDFDGKKITMGSQVFRVKNVPDPVAKVANLKGGPIQKTTLLAQAGIIPVMENFEFELYFKINKFTFSMYGKGRDPIDLSASSNQITQQMKDAMAKAKAGDKIYFENIYATGPDGSSRKLAPVNFTVQ